MRVGWRHVGAKGLDGLRACAAAFQFLTRLPVNVRLSYTDDLFRRSTVYYPLVGLVVGGLLALAAWPLAMVLPSMPASVLLTGMWVALTGALHVDGLMDTADGLLSHRPREKMLEIMKDSRVGAMGVIAGALLLLFKASLLASLLEGWTAEGAVLAPAAAVMLAPVWGRWFVVWAIASWPNARAGSGLGGLFATVGRREAAASTLPALLATGAVWLAFGQSASEAVLYTVGLIVLTGAIGYGLARSMARKLGGLTGDTYGALAETLECTVLLAAVLMLHNG